MVSEANAVGGPSRAYDETVQSWGEMSNQTVKRQKMNEETGSVTTFLHKGVI